MKVPSKTIKMELEIGDLFIVLKAMFFFTGKAFMANQMLLKWVKEYNFQNIGVAVLTELTL
jgi:hypothetical protein